MSYTINSSEKKHNGWTNYATWRVNLEVFDGMDAREHFTAEVRDYDAYSLPKQLEEYAIEIITDFGQREGLAVDYALAFLSDVNWYEIAEHMLDDIKADET